MNRGTRQFSSGTAAHAQHGSGYPFDRLTGTLNQQSGSNISHRSPVKPASQGQLLETVHNMIEQLRQMKSARQFWDVAVKRNGMTTSLALLGGVLVADVFLYPGKQQQRAHAPNTLLQTNLAAAPSNSSSSNSSQHPSSSSSSSNRHGVSSHGTGAPAHAKLFIWR